jgi:hypothetical protein
MALQLAHNYVPAYDNLDGLQKWQSDMLCSAVTGAGISKRELYSDQEEVILSFKHCPAINGVSDPAEREDIVDRVLKLELKRIEEKDRKAEARFWADFGKVRPKILGALSGALSGALKIRPTVDLSDLPRMADFALWGYAVAEALGDDGDEEAPKNVISFNGEKFLEVYRKNRE